MRPHGAADAFPVGPQYRAHVGDAMPTDAATWPERPALKHPWKQTGATHLHPRPPDKGKSTDSEWSQRPAASESFRRHEFTSSWNAQRAPVCAVSHLCGDTFSWPPLRSPEASQHFGRDVGCAACYVSAWGVQRPWRRHFRLAVQPTVHSGTRGSFSGNVHHFVREPRAASYCDFCSWIVS